MPTNRSLNQTCYAMKYLVVIVLKLALIGIIDNKQAVTRP